MNGRVRQSLTAKADLRELSVYSKRQFGIARTLQYAQHLQNELRALASGYNYGVVDSQLWPGLLRYRVENHNVFFTRIPDGIFVSRILHTKRSAELHVFPTGS